MLVFVGGAGHGCELVCLLQGLYGGQVERKVAERGAVVGTLREGASGEVEVVGGPEEEDAFAVRGLKKRPGIEGCLGWGRAYALERSRDL